MPQLIQLKNYGHMFDRLSELERRFEELNVRLSDPAVTSDGKKYGELAKEHSDLSDIVVVYRKWSQSKKELVEAKELLEVSDSDMRELALAEVRQLESTLEELEKELVVLVAPKDPNDDKNIILEMRAGAGGDESALFCEELFSSYCKYAEEKRWKIELLNTSSASVGGFKDVVAQIYGKGAYSRFKFESGVHRVQRVPKTETQGRVHTSTVTVAVLPEAEDIQIDIQDKDLRIDVFRTSGPGGQSVNTTDSAVRVTHLPTGLVVICQDGKSQHGNKDKALKVLRSRLLEREEQAQHDERSQNRRSQIGTGDRSEKIRTYNFPQGRVTDHRIGLTLYQIDTVMNGKLDLLIDPLATHYRAEALKEQNSEQ